jgi:hypothetical protein
MTHVTPLRPLCCSWASPTEPSWMSWAGRTARWSSGTRTSLPGSAATSRTGWTRTSGRQMRLGMRLNRPEGVQTLIAQRHLSWSELVVRGRVELPTFRFSGECPGPHEFTTVRLIRPDDLLGHLGVHERPHVSTTVVSIALATGLYLAPDLPLPRRESAQGCRCPSTKFLIFVNRTGVCAQVALRYRD